MDSLKQLQEDFTSSTNILDNCKKKIFHFRHLFSEKPECDAFSGKSIATSVPSFAIRFHTGGEELEEIYPSAEEADDEAEKPEEEANSVGSASIMMSSELLPPMSTSTTSGASMTMSTSASSTTAPSRDPSPMKEYLKGLGKRSTSMDAGIIDIGTSGASSSDTWRIFHELKGKITKTVEEKFSEMKSDRKSSSLLSSGPDVTKGSRLSACGKSKDNSSISDSEDISETSSKIGILKEEESSPRKSSGMKEEKQSSSFEKEEKDDPCSDSLTDPPSTSSAAFEASDSVDMSPQGLVKKNNFRIRMKHNISNLRHRHKSSHDTTSLGASVKMSSLSNSDVKELADSDIEPAMEVSEETSFILDQNEIALIEPDIPTTDYRTSIPTTHPASDLRKHSIHARGLTKLWNYKYYVLCLGFFLTHFMLPIPSFVTGFIFGAVCVAIYYYIRDFLRRHAPLQETSGVEMNALKFVIPNFSILPAVKEYQPLTKYEGWMNEYLDDYEPETYTINNTQSVYVRLEGSILRISHTRLKIPKRAMWNERKHKFKFTHQRIYNIAQCEVKLLPSGLARKRLWSKKYPICIVLRRNAKCSVQYLQNKDDTVDEEPDPSEQEHETFANQNLEVEVTKEVDPCGKVALETLSSTNTATAKDPLGDVESDLTKQPVKTEAKEAQSIEEEELSVQEDFSDEDTFCHIDETAMEENCLYLFSRTDREKEDWYRRFASATKHCLPATEEAFPSTSLGTYSVPKVHTGLTSPSGPSDQVSIPPLISEAQQQTEMDDVSEEISLSPQELEESNIDYLKFMSQFHLQVLTPKGLRVLSQSPFHCYHHTTHPNSHEKIETDVLGTTDKEMSTDVMWLNSLVGRILFDVLRNPYWIVKIQERIQKKLSAIRLPYFVEDLEVTELEVGNTLPLVHRASKPVLDQRGLWVDLEVSYEGTLSLTLGTKLNLMKLKKAGEEVHPSSIRDELSPTEKRGSPMYNSDVDDTAESSDDDSDLNKTTSEEEFPGSPSGSCGGTGKKILQMVNKIAASKYFQHAAEYKYIKRAMEEVSNTRIMLSVELKGLDGVLCLNIPPHPSDRLWYGFRGNPHIWLSARPKFGERQVNISHVISWIEKKLIQEFQKKFVLPNMDDLVISPMSANLPE